MVNKRPLHIAIIMDGNGRWAEAQGLARTAGHRAGAQTVREIVEECRKLGVKALTLYSFSTENWRRPQDEVDALMGLLGEYLREEADQLQKNDIRLRGIGELSQLPPHLQSLLHTVEEITTDNQGMELILALSYGGRSEIVHAARTLAEQVQAGSLRVEEIDEASLSAHLYTQNVADPDLIIRTSGEMRISNFLLWQSAYSEFYVTKVPWPEFRAPHLHEAIESFQNRKRRFGKVTDAA